MSLHMHMPSNANTPPTKNHLPNKKNVIVHIHPPQPLQLCGGRIRLGEQKPTFLHMFSQLQLEIIILVPVALLQGMHLTCSSLCSSQLGLGYIETCL